MKYHLAVITLCISGWVSAEAADIGGGKLSVSLTYRSTYDSNLLHYSSRDRDRFLDNAEPHNSPIRALDDIRSDFKLSTSYSFNAWSPRETRLSVVTNFAHHMMNPIKNFGWISLTAKQEILKTLSASFNYFYEPRYYIRDYLDVHSDERRSCEFALDQWTGRVYYRPKWPFEFLGIGRFKRYAYNKYFTEYDSDYLEFGGEVIFRTGSYRFSGGYSLADNKNVSFNALDYQHTGLDSEDSEEGQSDYLQDTYSISLRYEFRIHGKRSRILLEASLKDRYYSTDRELQADPIHRGRRDVTVFMEISGRIKLNSDLAVLIGSAYGNRRSRSGSPIVPQIKDYDDTIGWVEISYELW